MYKRILVPVDGSPTSALGLSEAVRLASDQHAALRIVHVLNEWLTISPDASGANLEEAAEALRVGGEAILDQADKVARGAGIEAQTVLVEEMGDPAGLQIIRQAIEWPADLIVCGTHGRHGVRRLLVGSDAEYIVRHSPVPVLLLRSRSDDEAEPPR